VWREALKAALIAAARSGAADAVEGPLRTLELGHHPVEGAAELGSHLANDRNDRQTDAGREQGLELDDAIKARDGEPRCGAYIVDTRSGDILHWIRFDGAVRELFDAAFIPGVRAPMCVGLGNPEMRTLITFDGEGSGTKAEVAA
jgi:hypothetical protein